MRQMRSAGRKRGSLLAAALGFAFLGCLVGAAARGMRCEVSHGFTRVVVGTQAALLALHGLMTMSAPLAHEHNGGAITGIVLSQLTLSSMRRTTNIVGESSTNTPGYPPAGLD